MLVLFHTCPHPFRRLLSRCIPTARISCFLWCNPIVGFSYQRLGKMDAGLVLRLLEKLCSLFHSIRSIVSTPILRLSRKLLFFLQHEFAPSAIDNSKVFWTVFSHGTCVDSQVLLLRTKWDFLCDFVSNVRRLSPDYLWAMLFCSTRASNKVGFSFSLRKGSGRFCKVPDEPSVQLISVSIGVKC